LTDSARVGLLLTTMTALEADEFGIPEDDRHQYVRLDDVKRNMAPAGRARWYRLCQVPLGNGAPGYPNGDNVAAIGPWEPRSVWQTASDPDINDALDEIDRGLHGGGRFTDSRRGDGARWAGHILVRRFSITDKQAANMLAVWIKNGVLFREEYFDKSQRKPRTGLNLDPLKRPGPRNG
jgi:hypothetical protein